LGMGRGMRGGYRALRWRPATAKRAARAASRPDAGPVTNSTTYCIDTLPSFPESRQISPISPRREVTSAAMAGVVRSPARGEFWQVKGAHYRADRLTLHATPDPHVGRWRVLPSAVIHAAGWGKRWGLSATISRQAHSQIRNHLPNDFDNSQGTFMANPGARDRDPAARVLLRIESSAYVSGSPIDLHRLYVAPFL
jgi:hypothetical protein